MLIETKKKTFEIPFCQPFATGISRSFDRCAVFDLMGKNVEVDNVYTMQISSFRSI